LINVNGTLFFVADDGTHGQELWKSDGTSKGTVLVADINTGGSSDPASLTNVNGTLFFSANDGTHGTELWKTNGTATGTVMVKDINPGSAASYPSDLTNGSGTLFFAANDGNHGTELWKSDGSAAGTVLVKDINPGSASSNPANLTLAGGHLFFAADDGYHGVELWDPPVGLAPATVVVPTSEGMSGAGGTPRLSVLPHQGHAGAGILSTAGVRSSRTRQDFSRLLNKDLSGSTATRASDALSTGLLDQALAAAASHPKKTRFGWALDRLWDSDLLEDLALSGQLG
jgi:ELWxxDGT repeat protein